MINITTKHNSKSELKIKKIIENLIKKYNGYSPVNDAVLFEPEKDMWRDHICIPIFQKKIEIDDNTKPHSHPHIVLSTHATEPKDVLENLVHEQFHYYEDYKNCGVFNDYVKNTINILGMNLTKLKTMMYWITSVHI